MGKYAGHRLCYCFVLFLLGLVACQGTPTPTPTPTPVPVTPVGPVVPTPSAALQTAVAPIKAAMATADKAKAVMFAQAWADLAGELGGVELSTLNDFKQTVL